MKIPQCKVSKHKRFERAEVIGPSNIRNEVVERLCKNGWRLTHSGPYTDKKMFPTIDATRFRIGIERELTS